jgi:hypothetical protein
MSKLYQFLAKFQSKGRINSEDVPLIREKLTDDGRLDIDDVKLLVELYCETEHRCPEFDSLFFSTLEKVFLTDNQINPSEEYYLLKMLYGDRDVREPEREFLRKLRKQLPERSASFEALYETAMESTGPSCGVGGRRS